MSDHDHPPNHPSAGGPAAEADRADRTRAFPGPDPVVAVSAAAPAAPARLKAGRYEILD